jgi:hypothetical protein
MNAFKSEKLRTALLKVPSRTMNDAFQRILGDGDKVKGALKNLIKSFDKKKKHAIEFWMKFVIRCQKGDMFDAIRSQRLKQALFNLQMRTIRDSSKRILGAGDVIIGSITA